MILYIHQVSARVCATSATTCGPLLLPLPGLAQVGFPQSHPWIRPSDVNEILRPSVPAVKCPTSLFVCQKQSLCCRVLPPLGKRASLEPTCVTLRVVSNLRTTIHFRKAAADKRQGPSDSHGTGLHTGCHAQVIGSCLASDDAGMQYMTCTSPAEQVKTQRSRNDA